MAGSPLLNYAISSDPFPLQAGPSSGTGDPATMTLEVWNSGDAAVVLEGIPVGDGPTELTSQASDIAVTVPTDWTIPTTSSWPIRKGTASASWTLGEPKSSSFGSVDQPLVAGHSGRYEITVDIYPESALPTPQPSVRNDR